VLAVLHKAVLAVLLVPMGTVFCFSFSFPLSENNIRNN